MHLLCALPQSYEGHRSGTGTALVLLAGRLASSPRPRDKLALNQDKTPSALLTHLSVPNESPDPGQPPVLISPSSKVGHCRTPVSTWQFCFGACLMTPSYRSCCQVVKLSLRITECDAPRTFLVSVSGLRFRSPFPVHFPVFIPVDKQDSLYVSSIV